MNELLINAVGPLREWFFGLGDIGMVLWIVLKILAIAMPVIISRVSCDCCGESARNSEVIRVVVISDGSRPTASQC